MAICGTHYKALMRKNYLLWSRNICGSICEIAVPVILALFFFVIRNTVERTVEPETSYLKLQKIDKIYSDFPSTFNQTQIQMFQMINCWTRQQSGFKGFRSGSVALMPNNQYTQRLQQIMSQYKSASGKQFTFKFFNNLNEFDDYVTGENYKQDICIGLNLEEKSQNVFETRIMYNTTGMVQDIPDTQLQEVYEYKPEDKSAFYDPYISKGSLQIKNWMDNAIFQVLSNSTNVQIHVDISPLKQQSYTDDSLSTILQGNMGTFLVLPLIVVFLRMCNNILSEKEKKIREGMKIMGMKDSSFYLSWISWYMIIYTINSIIISLILKGAVYQYSDWTLIFIWHWIFSMTLIAQSLFITSFFSSAKLGNIIAMVFYLFMYMFQYIIGTSETTPENVNNAAGLSSQTAFALATNVFLLVETQSTGISWSNIGQKIGNFSVGSSIGLFFFNFIFFMLLALYFDQVIPNDFGKKQHPLFCFQWFCKKRKAPIQVPEEDDKDLVVNNNKIEEVAAGLRVQESQNEVLKLTKAYRIYSNGKKAVNGVSLTMYKNQIFCLLGHNGAGKTSTISMLTGMFEFSAGGAEVYGKDVQTQMDEIRSFMGVCPQHDILFPDLTVQEHLELFAVFKGMAAKDIKAAVIKAIQDVDLQEKAEELSKNLSGGQKRRLSVAIAFIGDSKLIYLDEPTSGMDTSARRYIWDMLKRYKNDKIIVLTTHFMDEADYLGDRIGIMGEGKLICCGSSVFLKNNFGVGYNLTIVKNSTDIDSQPITNSIKSIIPTANKLSDVSQEISFQLPMNTLSQFESLFNMLDSQKGQLNISSYGISITTLEEVFLKVAETQASEKQNDFINSGQRSSKVSPDGDQEEEQAKNNVQIPMKDQIDNFDLNSVKIQGTFNLFMAHFWSIIIKRVLYFKRDKRGFVCEVFLPCVVVIFGLCLLLITFIKDSPELVISQNFYGDSLNVIWGGQLSQNYENEIMSKLPKAFDWKNSYFSSSNATQWEDENFKKRSLQRKGAYWFNSADLLNQTFSYLTQVQTISRSSPLYFVNQMNSAIISFSTKKNIEIVTVNQPMKLTQKVKSIKGTVDGFVAAFMFSIGLAFIPASIITYIVKEKSDMVKHQHLVSGVSLVSYWAANFVIDVFKYAFPAVFCMIMVQAFSISTFVDQQVDYSAVCLLFILYGWAIIPFCYITAFLFSNYGSAQVYNFFFHFILGAIFPLIVFILRIIQSTASVGKILGWIFRLIPSFSFGYGIINIGSKSIYSIRGGLTDPYQTFDLNIAGGDVLLLSLEGVGYMLIVFLIEFLLQKSSFTQFISGENKVAYIPQEQDDDVQKEMELIQNSKPSDYTVRVKELRKVYITQGNRSKVAVDNVSFGIKQGQVFTLLGVNGAGKSTTFKILSGEIKPTRGEAHIAGYSVQNDMAKARQNIGYCPQFDALLDNLTAREHLKLYAAIKGIPSNMREKLIEKKLVEMDLKKYEGVLAGTFSGGNKRKLSVAIAMLGQPSIVFLDEPSTGMDPAARRFMWDVISRITTINKSSSVILTTHSMEEAEALSSRVAIQVEGNLQCIGTIQEIKNKFGKGYEVEVKIQKPTPEDIQELAKLGQIESVQHLIHPNNLNNILQRLNHPELIETIAEKQIGEILFKQMNSPSGLQAELLLEYVYIQTYGNQIKEFISQQFGLYDVIEHFSDFYRFRIDTQVSIGKIFGQFEKNKASLKISEYSLKQATIEQIFNLFAEGKIRVNDHLKKQQALERMSQQKIQSNNQTNIEMKHVVVEQKKIE